MMPLLGIRTYVLRLTFGEYFLVRESSLHFCLIELCPMLVNSVVVWERIPELILFAPWYLISFCCVYVAKCQCWYS